MNLVKSFSMLLLSTLALSALAQEEWQSVSRSATRAQVDAPTQFFTGGVRITPQFDATPSTPFSGGYVTFEPGARSAWHTHPSGQRLLVTSGVGRTQVWGGPVIEIREGDVIWCPPGVKHWHGAAPGQAMTHLALTGSVEGKNVSWMEKVTDEQYLKQK